MIALHSIVYQGLRKICLVQFILAQLLIKPLRRWGKLWQDYWSY